MFTTVQLLVIAYTTGSNALIISVWIVVVFWDVIAVDMVFVAINSPTKDVLVIIIVLTPFIHVFVNFVWISVSKPGAHLTTDALREYVDFLNDDDSKLNQHLLNKIILSLTYWKQHIYFNSAYIYFNRVHYAKECSSMKVFWC